MAENTAPEMKSTLGLTGLTMNAMALIAPRALLWLTAQGLSGARPYVELKNKIGDAN